MKGQPGLATPDSFSLIPGEGSHSVGVNFAYFYGVRLWGIERFFWQVHCGYSEGWYNWRRMEGHKRKGMAHRSPCDCSFTA